MSEFRIERDSMGEVRVPAGAKWRAQTQRAIENFPVSGRVLDPSLIAALGLIKAVAAEVNGELGVIEKDMAEAIAQIGQVVESVQTADEVMRLAGRHGIDLPISAGVQAVLHGDITPVDGLRQLLAREQKPEYPDTLFR